MRDNTTTLGQLAEGEEAVTAEDGLEVDRDVAMEGRAHACPEVSVGDTAAEAVVAIVRANTAIRAVTTFLVDVGPASGDRIDDLPVIRPLVEKALELRGSYGVPFWTAIALTAEKVSVALPSELIRTALFHREMRDEGGSTISAADLDPFELARAVPDAKTRVFSSCVDLADGSEAHIPMLDFRTPTSPTGQKTVERVIAELGLKGAILESGNSYHFWAYESVSWEVFQDFLARASLLEPVVDRRWISHQIIEGRAALRVSAHPKMGMEPIVVG